MLEITDLLWPIDGDGALLPTVKTEVVASLLDHNQRRAARIVSRMPATDGVLDPSYVDALGIRVHRELVRLSEELQFGRRVAARLQQLAATLCTAGGGLIRVVDVGCGIGYVIRWLAATSALGPDVELVGVDLNPALVAEASKLAAIEGLNCRFLRGDAFEPGAAVDDGAATIVISSGLMHHIPAPDLQGFFAAQARLGVAAFAHWDIAPCLWSTLGAWIFHQARMREPVSRHDGVMSARRAHAAPILEAAARTGARGYHATVLESAPWHPHALDVLRPIVGWR